MGPAPVLSVGLPVYNGERYLRRAIESILSQSFDDFELIISDNASSDATQAISLEFAARDPRVRYVRSERNVGAAGNYNRAYHESRGRYFKWTAHDDWYAPTFLARCVEVLDADPSAALCYSPAVFVDESGTEIGREQVTLDFAAGPVRDRFRAWVYEKRDGWCHPITGVIRSDMLRRTPLIGPYAGSDRILIAELALHGRVQRLDEYLFYRRDHAGRSTAANDGVEEITAWFDTSVRRGRVYLPRWRWGFEYARAVARADLSARDRSACLATVVRWSIRARHRLWRELKNWTSYRVFSRSSVARENTEES